MFDQTHFRYLIAALVVLNLLLFLRLVDLLPQMIGDAPEPARVQAQISPDRLRVVPAGR